MTATYINILLFMVCSAFMLTNTHQRAATWVLDAYLVPMVLVVVFLTFPLTNNPLVRHMSRCLVALHSVGYTPASFLLYQSIINIAL